MKALLIAGMVMVSAGGMAHAGQPKARVNESANEAQLVKPAPLFLSQRRSTPDTSTPGSTAPGHPAISRPAYSSQKEQYYAAELRRCETIGETDERAACRNSARSKFGEM